MSSSVKTTGYSYSTETWASRTGSLVTTTKSFMSMTVMSRENIVSSSPSDTVTSMVKFSIQVSKRAVRRRPLTVTLSASVVSMREVIGSFPSTRCGWRSRMSFSSSVTSHTGTSTASGARL